MIEDFWNELSKGEIHVRDRLQFELKSEFFINPSIKENIYKQEVFLFIPASLQINRQTYSKQQFYLDQTNLIRYKTPPITLSSLIDPESTSSPLNRLHLLLKESKTRFFNTASDELKLFGAVFRSSLRERIDKLLRVLTIPELQKIEQISLSIILLCEEIIRVCHQFRKLQEIINPLPNQQQLVRHFRYIDEFISITIDEFLVILLKQLRVFEKQKANDEADQKICRLIIKEKLYRKKKHMGPKTSRDKLFANESILYRQGLLNRFVMESLMLKNYRFSLAEKHTHILGAMAAGIAMLVYMILFVWKGSELVVNSFPFIALAVFLYILKDRVKEGFKNLYYRQAYRWFSDYSTEIRSPKGLKIGKLKENFAFIESKQLPPGFWKIRNTHFHEELQALQRQETIIQYKREMMLKPIPPGERRRRELTTIFRLNIHRFLQKASDAFQSNLTLDPYTREISERILPKVYHLNLIIRNTFLKNDLTEKIEIKTFRVVVDKAGIKRVEHIKSK